MDGTPEQRAGNQQDEAAVFSMRLGAKQPAENEPPTPQPAANVPPPLTPTPTPTPQPPAQGVLSSPLAAGATGQTSMPVQPPTPVVPRQRGPLGRPFPTLLTVAIAVGSFALVALVFAVRVMVLGGDWSDGAVAGGSAALVLVAIAIVVALVRVAAGRRTLGFAITWLLLLLSLAATGMAGLFSSDSLHLVQAQAMEKSGQWSAAIHEYGLSGQNGSNAANIARVQNAWGDQLLKQKDYQGALTHYQIVLDDYQQSNGAVAHALKGQFDAYAAWLKDDPNHVPYRDAIAAFANYSSTAACASDCKATLAAVAPQAYYLYGVQLLGQKRYALAISEFTKLVAQYSASTYATQAHGKAATAYLDYGKQQISNQECTNAVTTYRTLVANYKDTPEAVTAQNALNAPQDVTGFIANVPTNPVPTLHLSKNMNFASFFFSDEYSTSIDPKTGAFTFRLVAQGTYYISMSRPVSGGIDYVAWWADASHTSYFSFAVTPLCTVQLGNMP